MKDGLLDAGKFPRQGELDAQIVDDILEALFNLGEGLVDIFPLRGEFVALVEHVGDLDIVVGTFYGGRGNYIFSGRIAQDDGRDLAELRRAGQRTTAKFYNLDLHSISNLSERFHGKHHRKNKKLFTL